MKTWKALPFLSALLVLQAQAPPTDTPPTPPVSQSSAPGYPVTLIQGSSPTLDYRSLKSTARIHLKGTPIAPEASGVAKVRNREGTIQVIARMEKLPPPTSFGPGYLTYIMWGISPEGQVSNLGEVIPKNGKASLEISCTGPG